MAKKKDPLGLITNALDKGKHRELKNLLQEHSGLVAADGNTARLFSNAVLFRDEKAIRLMVEIGLDVNSRLAPGKTALATAVTRDDPEMVKLLLQLGADPTIDSAEALLPVNASVGSKQQSLEMLRLLHEHGCDVCQTFYTKRDNSPQNALMIAMMYGKDDVVAYLKSLGCMLPDQASELA